MLHVNAAALPELKRHVAVPDYDPSTLPGTIVHFGVGAFHRAHQAMYLDRLLNAGETGWGICGVGILPSDAAMRDVFQAQDNLYTLVTVTPEGHSEARIIGSIVDYLFAPDDPATVIARLADTATRIVSLTITEGGYGVDDATGEFAPQDAATLSDLESAGGLPRSAFGFIVAGLRQRRDDGVAPFTVMSCDNMQGNGEIARKAILAFATRIDPALADWIADSVVFPSSMVDRITPATTDDTRRSIAEEFGIEDQWPVRSESFEQWVLEDHFPLGRPDWSSVGVQLVDDVEPYELMKLRLLNASHQAMGYLGLLSGLTYVDEAAKDPLFVDFLLGYMKREAIPTLLPVPGVDLSVYCAQLIERFASEATKDTLARLVVDGSDRIPKFVLPVLREQLRTGGETKLMSLIVASWATYLETEPTRDTLVVDRRRDQLLDAIGLETSLPGAFLDLESIFGTLGAETKFRREYLEWREVLRNSGARSSLEMLTSVA